MDGKKWFITLRTSDSEMAPFDRDSAEFSVVHFLKSAHSSSSSNSLSFAEDTEIVFSQN
jgi:hypothetical protein